MWHLRGVRGPRHGGASRRLQWPGQRPAWSNAGPKCLKRDAAVAAPCEWSPALAGNSRQVSGTVSRTPELVSRRETAAQSEVRPRSGDDPRPRRSPTPPERAGPSDATPKAGGARAALAAVGDRRAVAAARPPHQLLTRGSPGAPRPGRSHVHRASLRPPRRSNRIAGPRLGRTTGGVHPRRSWGASPSTAREGSARAGAARLHRCTAHRRRDGGRMRRRAPRFDRSHPSDRRACVAHPAPERMPMSAPWGGHRDRGQRPGVLTWPWKRGQRARVRGVVRLEPRGGAPEGADRGATVRPRG